jgi:hypothetical protein
MRGTWSLFNARTLISSSVVGSLALLAVVAAAPANAATSYTVSTTADIAANAGACGNPGITAAPSPLSLREATCLANNSGATAVTINIPSGTYVLSSGELAPGQVPGSNITMAGAGASATVISANNASRVLDLDKNLTGGVTTSISSLTITGGADSTFGGAGIIAGSNNNTTLDSLTLSNVIVTGNAANGASPGVTNKPGGGIQFLGGKLSISDSTISNNSSASSYGSGVAYGANGAASPESLTITNTTFSGNSTANSHGDAGTANGGALAMFGTAGSNFSVANSRFVNNTATSTASSGPAEGAAIWDQSGNLTVTGSTFTGNSVSGGASSDVGGAIEVTSGTAALHYDRFVGNSAPAGGALHSGGTTDATENWWGCNTGPGTAGCDSVTGSATVSPRLVLTATASPATVIGPNGTSTITARLTTDSLGAAQNASNFGAFAALPVTFSDPPGDATVTTTAGPHSAALSGGVASIDYHSGATTIGPDPDSITFDNATVSTTVTVDEAPAITSANTAQFTVGTAGSFSVTSTGYPAAAITETGTLPAGLTFTDNGNGTATLAGTPTGPGGSFSLSITANNGVSPNATQTLTVTVGAPPSFTSSASASFSVGHAGTFQIATSGSPAVSSITEAGTLPAGLTFVDNGDGTATLAGTPTGPAGSFPVSLTASNGISPNASQTLTITVNQAPAITSANTAQFTVGSAGSFAVTSTGSPAATLTETGTLPAGLTFTDNGDGTATLAGTPTGPGGSFSLSITANNGVSPNATQTLTVTVASAPSITSAASTTFSVGTAGSFTVTTTGSPVPTITENGALPAGLTFVDNGDGTATLSGTPAAGSGGSYTVTVTASNGTNPDATQNLSIQVNEAPSAPTGVTATVTGSTAQVSWTAPSSDGGAPITSYTVTGTDTATSATLTATVTGNPPATTASVSGLVTGHSYTFTVTATNADNLTSPPSAPSAPVSSGSPPTVTGTPPSGAVGTAYSFAFSTTGSPAPAVTSSGSLPPGLVLSGTGVLSGTPTASGSYSFTVTASNGIAPDASDAVTVFISAVVPGAPTGVTAVAGNASATVSWTAPSFTGGSPILSYTVTGTDTSHAAAPVTVLVSGAPVPTSATVSGLTPGDAYTFTVVATSTAGSSANSAPSAPVVPFAPPTISGTPGPATVGVAYSFSFTTTGYPAPAVTATGTLPPGLTLSTGGTLSGTPTTPGTYNFTVVAANGHAPNASRSVSITVATGAPATVTATSGMNQAATAGQPFANRLSATVTDGFANPVAGVNVTFAVTSGSATFPGGVKTVVVATNAAGLATAPVLTAGKTAGPVTVTASAGSAVPATFNETVLSVGSARADLVVTLSAPASAAKNSTFTVSVTVKNKGPNSASLMLTTLNLGAGLNVVSAPGGSTFGGSVLYSASGLASNASLTYTVTVKAGHNAFSTGLFAGALSIVPDPVLSNNLAAVKFKIT